MATFPEGVEYTYRIPTTFHFGSGIDVWVEGSGIHLRPQGPLVCLSRVDTEVLIGTLRALLEDMPK